MNHSDSFFCPVPSLYNPVFLCDNLGVTDAAQHALRRSCSGAELFRPLFICSVHVLF
jgi:hypothetical protein